MNDLLTLNELKNHLQPLDFFGDTLFEIKKNDKGYIINILDYEEGYVINSQGEKVTSDSKKTTKYASLYLNSDKKIIHIQHQYPFFSKGNKDQVQLLLDLLEKTLEIKELA